MVNLDDDKKLNDDAGLDADKESEEGEEGSEEADAWELEEDLEE